MTRSQAFWSRELFRYIFNLCSSDVPSCFPESRETVLRVCTRVSWTWTRLRSFLYFVFYSCCSLCHPAISALSVMSGQFAPWRRTACPLPCVDDGWVSTASVSSCSWCCQNDSDASCSPYVHLRWRFERSCALCAQTGCCIIIISSFSGIVCVSSLCERYDAAHICMWNIRKESAVVESNSIFIQVHTRIYFLFVLLCSCTSLHVKGKYVWGKCCVYFLNWDDERFSV